MSRRRRSNAAGVKAPPCFPREGLGEASGERAAAEEGERRAGEVQDEGVRVQQRRGGFASPTPPLPESPEASEWPPGETER
mmetsp:Transcript_145384/g.368939  ORF Transcript_145384/g.368939 Transcript_145384/m.368939 type:complete len:81 (+) Transcript_145384:193-435(+)